MASGSNPVRAIFYAFFANLAIAVTKTAAAIYTGSSSMTAEAIHSFADSGNQLLLLLGLRGARKPSDPEHPLGYGKVTYFWSFIVALLLFSVGGLFSLYEGWHKLHESGPIENGWIALVVLGFSIVLEAISMRGCLVEVNKIRGDRSLWNWLYRSRNSELVVVFGEDLAALVGLGIAFAFVSVAVATGDPIYDAYGSISIGVLLVIVALFIASRVATLLIGRSADPDVTAALARELERSPYILEVFNIITLQVGPQIMLAAKLRMTPGLSLGEAIEHINELERNLRAEVPELGWLFMEPDSQD
ncbi:MAG: cation diffusion facilitator family transporter [bacterium]|nr:cation diffusion facilitator family transporter [bacterium]